MILKIFAFILLAIGAAINYGAKLIAERMNLAEKMTVNEAEEFSGEELERYKMTKATVRVKMIGLLVLLPGIILIFIAFR